MKYSRSSVAVRALAFGLLLGLALLGGLVCLIALRMSIGWGLLLLLSTTASGLLVVSGHSAVRRVRARQLARDMVGEAESWLRQSPGRSEGAG